MDLQFVGKLWCNTTNLGNQKLQCENIEMDEFSWIIVHNIYGCKLFCLISGYIIDPKFRSRARLQAYHLS